MSHIPDQVIAEVARVLSQRFTRSQLDNLFGRLGMTRDEYGYLNKLDSATVWLRAANEHRDALSILGRSLREFMDDLPEVPFLRERRIAEQKVIHEALGRHGLAYQSGGVIFGSRVSTPTRSLDDLIRKRNIPEIHKEFDRALHNVDADPPAAITAACAILESLFKVIIADDGLQLPKDQSILPLWKEVQKHLKVDPAGTTAPDLKQILGGLASIVHGIAGLRTHAGSAHGRGRDVVPPSSRHARLAIHAADTLTVFVLETWKG
jgi:hypothetical protein